MLFTISSQDWHDSLHVFNPSSRVIVCLLNLNYLFPSYSKWKTSEAEVVRHGTYDFRLKKCRIQSTIRHQIVSREN